MNIIHSIRRATGEEGGRAANVVQKRGKKQVETGSTYEEGDVWMQ